MTVHVSNLASQVTFASEQAEAEDLIQEVEALSSDMQGTAGREAALLGQLRDKEQEVAKASTEYMRYSQVLCAAGARAKHAMTCVRARNQIMTTSKQQLAAADKLQEASAAKLAALNQVLAARSSAIVALEQKVRDGLCWLDANSSHLCCWLFRFRTLRKLCAPRPRRQSNGRHAPMLSNPRAG